MSEGPASLRSRLLPLQTAVKAVPWRWQTVCLMCGQWVRSGTRLAALCHYCLESLPWISAPCRYCALPASLCRRGDGSCQISPFSEAICPLLYQGYAARWVLRAKRSGGLPEARLLGSLLTLAVQDSYRRAGDDPELDPLPQLLLPVPLSWQRRLLRGHNQAQWIASAVAQALAIPLNVRDLQRQRHSVIQPGLSPRQRQQNVADAFVCRRRFDGEHVAVIDDVMTSGATVSAIAGLLYDAGCSRVDVWCATRALPS